MRCLTLLFVGILLFPNGGIAQADTSRANDVTYWVRLFNEVLQRTQDNYVNEVTAQAMTEAALRGMLASLDPHSTYITPTEFEELHQQYKGEYGGVGIELLSHKDVLKIASVYSGGPAETAGLLAGDIITDIDNQPVQELGVAQAIHKLRGTPGEEVTVHIRRPGEPPFYVTLVKEHLSINPVDIYTFDTTGYVRLSKFNEHAHGRLQEAICQLKKDLGPKLQGFILDLRNNPGGLFEQAIVVASTFLNNQEIVTVKSRLAEDARTYRSRSKDQLEGIPMVVLINEKSASCSEIVAGALQDHNRATIIGVRSFGKGSVQTVIPLPRYGSAIQISTGLYLTPNKRSIQAKGIEPNIVIPLQGQGHDHPRREENLPGALNTQKPHSQRDHGTREMDPLMQDPDPTRDAQLSRALEVLRPVAETMEKTP